MGKEKGKFEQDEGKLVKWVENPSYLPMTNNTVTDYTTRVAGLNSG